MKNINFHKSLETFLVFDIILIFLFLIFLFLGVLFYFLNYLFLLFLFIVFDFVILYAVFIEPRLLRVKKYNINLDDNYSRSLKIVFLSDFHIGSKITQRILSNVIYKTNQLKPDMVILGGDYVVWKKDEVSALEVLKDLEVDYGKYFVLGNHDYLDDPQYISQELSKWGYQDIDNKCLDIVFEGKKVNLCGVDDADYGSPVIDFDSLKENVKILIAHNPDELLNLRDGDFDLVLAGHTHNLQINLPFLKKFFLPNKLKGRASHGLRIVNGLRVIVSAGLGQVGVRARLFTPPEIMFVTINF